MTPLGEARSQMHVKDVQHFAIDKNNVDAQTAAAFAMTPGYIMIPASLNGKAAQGHIAVGAALQCAIFSKAPVIALKAIADKPSLIQFRPARCTSRISWIATTSALSSEIFAAMRSGLVRRSSPRHLCTL